MEPGWIDERGAQWPERVLVVWVQWGLQDTHGLQDFVGSWNPRQDSCGLQGCVGAGNKRPSGSCLGRRAGCLAACVSSL